MSARLRVIGPCLALGAVLFAVFGQVVGHEFFEYDLRQYLTQNLWVQRGLTGEGLVRAFARFDASIWHPVTWLSYMIEVEVFGLRPGPMHLDNVAIHAANAALVFLVLREMTGAPGRSFLVAALFALHPQRVESVAWIVERKGLLCAFFGLLALHFWTGWTREPRRGAYAAALLCFAAGVMSKAMLVTWPFAMLLLDRWPLRRTEIGMRRRIAEKLPFFAVAIVASIFTFLAQRAGGAVQTLERYPLAARLENVPLAYAAYLGRTFWPAKLSFYYEHLGLGATAAGLAVALLAIGAASALAIALRGRAPWLLVGWLWFLGTLVPVIGIVQVGGQSMADRFTYLPSIGIAIAIVWSAGWLLPARPVPRWGAIGLAAAVCAVLAVLSWRQIRFWKDTETLCRHALELDPGNQVARHLLGARLVNEGRAEEALPLLEEVHRVIPDDLDVSLHLAIAAGMLGRFDQAESALREVLRRAPDRADAHTELARVLRASGRAAEALGEAQEGARLAPANPRALLGLAGVLASLRRPAEARAVVERSLEIVPREPDAAASLGSALYADLQYAEAEIAFRRACELAPGRPDLRLSLALALRAQGEREAALIELDLAARLAPGFAALHRTRGEILEELQRPAEARAALERALEIDPHDVPARLKLARLLVRGEDLEGAERELRRAVEDAPGEAEARRGLALVLIGRRKLAEALPQARAALELRSGWPLAMGDLAWILARVDDPALRDPEQAVALAEAAAQASGRQHPGILDALAAAYAARGDIPRAAATAQEALERAIDQRDDAFATRVGRRLIAYRAGTVDLETIR